MSRKYEEKKSSCSCFFREKVFQQTNLCRSSRRRESFTLIEFLIVISIIAILAALLLPALNRARENAKSGKCVSNKKQAILAQIQYANDFGGYYIGYMQNADGNTNAGMWVSILTCLPNAKGLYVTNSNHGYVSRAVLQCPTQSSRHAPSDPSFDVYHSVYGIDHSSDSSSSTSRALKLGNYLINKRNPQEIHVFVLNRMKRPSDILIFADTLKVSNGYPFARFKWDANEETAAVVMAHNGKTAAAFADGHAGTYAGKKLNVMPYNLKYWYGNMSGSVGR